MPELKYQMFKSTENLPKLSVFDDILSKKDILIVADSLTKQRDKALFVLEYLTGGRVSELVGDGGVRKRQFELRTLSDGKEYLFITKLPVLKKYDFKKDPETGKKITIKRNTIRDVPIPIHKEKELYNILNEYLETLNHNDILFPFSRYTAWLIISTILSYLKPKADPEKKQNRMMNANHYLRHVRTTHLIKYYGMTMYQVMKFMGWSNTRQIERTYGHLFVDDIAMAMGS